MFWLLPAETGCSPALTLGNGHQIRNIPEFQVLEQFHCLKTFNSYETLSWSREAAATSCQQTLLLRIASGIPSLPRLRKLKFPGLV